MQNDKLRAAISEELRMEIPDFVNDRVVDRAVEVVADRISREFCVFEHEWTVDNKFPTLCRNCGVAKEE